MLPKLGGFSEYGLIEPLVSQNGANNRLGTRLRPRNWLRSIRVSFVADLADLLPQNDRSMTTAQMDTRLGEALNTPVVHVHSADELRAANARQRAKYDWDFSREREFMENLFCTRFNFLLIAYSLFVTAAAGALPNRPAFRAVCFGGAVLCLMVSLTIVRAYAKLDVLFKLLYGAFPDHPISMIDRETAINGRRLFRVNTIIAYWVPAFTVLSLAVSGVSSVFGWL